MIKNLLYMTILAAGSMAIANNAYAGVHGNDNNHDGIAQYKMQKMMGNNDMPCSKYKHSKSKAAVDKMEPAAGHDMSNDTMHDHKDNLRYNQ